MLTGIGLHPDKPRSPGPASPSTSRGCGCGMIVNLEWDRVFAHRTAFLGDCWLWTGCTIRRGYGQVSWGGRQYPAHRLSFILAVSAPPEALYICHHCDRPACIRPTHLFAGTPSDNMQDAIRKGRAARGTRQGSAVLTDNDVVMMRSASAAGVSHSALATAFNVAPATVRLVIIGRTWAHIPKGD